MFVFMVNQPCSVIKFWYSNPGTGEVMRVPVPDDKVLWSTLHEWYDPPDFTNDTVASTDTDDL